MINSVTNICPVIIFAIISTRTEEARAKMCQKEARKEGRSDRVLTREGEDRGKEGKKENQETRGEKEAGKEGENIGKEGEQEKGRRDIRYKGEKETGKESRRGGIGKVSRKERERR